MIKLKVLKNHDKMLDAFAKYSKLLNKTAERREIWTTETKKRLIDVLTTVQHNFKVGWVVNHFTDVENCQAVTIQCHSKKSGISQLKINNSTGKISKTKSYVKHGGCLTFGQTYNGKICILVGFPYIEEWIDKMESKVLDTLEPEDITEELITKYVILFLEKMTKWEGADRLPIDLI